MAQPPFMNSTGLISKIFEKIAEAQRPDRFTHDYLSNVLGFSGGSARPMIGLLKRLGFLQSDGTPTPLYARYRNASERASAMLEAMRNGYPTLYARSEYAHLLPKDKLRELIVEVTGLDRENGVAKAILSTFLALKAVGSVDEKTKVGGGTQPSIPAPASDTAPSASAAAAAATAQDFGSRRNGEEIGLNLSYTINLNLPPSPNPEVFNAIFRALKEHLLGK